MTRIDFSVLSTQHAKSYRALDFEQIMPLYNYHPWEDGKNPRIDKTTNNLINLKKNQMPAVRYFSKVVRSQFLSIVCTEPRVFCVVPSHTQNVVSPALMTVMENIKKDFGFTNSTNLLIRTQTVPKSATGGDRSMQHHLDSISVTNPSIVQDKVVFLFDDISTTGSSLKACRRLLLETGAQKVVMISFGQTWSQ